MQVTLADVYFPLFGTTLFHYFVFCGDYQSIERYFKSYESAIIEDVNRQTPIEIGLNKRNDICVNQIINYMINCPKSRIPKFGKIVEILS